MIRACIFKKRYLQKLDQSYQPKQEMIDLMLDISTTKTSTTSMFQVIDEDLLSRLVNYLKGSESDNFVLEVQIILNFIKTLNANTQGTQKKDQQWIGLFNCVLPGLRP